MKYVQWYIEPEAESVDSNLLYHLYFVTLVASTWYLWDFSTVTIRQKSPQMVEWSNPPLDPPPSLSGQGNCKQCVNMTLTEISMNVKMYSQVCNLSKHTGYFPMQSIAYLHSLNMLEFPPQLQSLCRPFLVMSEHPI